MEQGFTLESLAKMIDHSLLHPTMTDDDIRAGCLLAKNYGTASACVKPYSVPLAREVLSGSGTLVCSVIGFPHGNSTAAIKAMEAEEAAMAGAKEIDMVVNIGKVLGRDWKHVLRELRMVNEASIANGAIVKAIFETAYLSEAHIMKLCEICAEAGVAFAKTSTGYAFIRQDSGLFACVGSTDANLVLMKSHVPASIQVKAAGGVRTLDDLLRVRALGVARIGATATQAILEEAKVRLGISKAAPKAASQKIEGY